MNTLLCGRTSAIAFALFAASLTACAIPAEGASDTEEAVSALGESPAPTPAPAPDPPPPPSLKTLKAPEPKNIDEFVADKNAAIVLGKALFWDMQLGSDGVTACASCHFHAGADSRSKNQLNPGLAARDANLEPAPDTTFSLGGPNYQLRASDFPLHKVANPDDAASAVLADSNDSVGSQGVTRRDFDGTDPGRAEDDAHTVKDEDGFRVHRTNTRRVTTRNAPSIINAVYNFRNFWDGRAENVFNGVNSLGDRDSSATVLRADGRGHVEQAHVRLENASLASQAMEPALGDVEMSAAGRTLRDVGAKLGTPDAKDRRGSSCRRGHVRGMAALRPLARQVVAKDDSVLGGASRSPRTGLDVASYGELIEKAFRPEWWRSDAAVEVDDSGRVTVKENGHGASNRKNVEVYSVLESNFSLFFGLAIQSYEATLVSDETPFDAFAEGNKSALTDLEQKGLALFRSQDRGRCINCHGGPEFTDAGITRLSKNHLRRREGNIIDFGFSNIGVRPTLEDLGIGEDDASPLHTPLSEARLAFEGKFTDATLAPSIGAADTLGADGAFKTPSLRNVALTAPYFHNGGQGTLRQVIEFYSRGGDFLPIHGTAGNTISGLRVLRLSEDEKNALEAFLRALTDPRVVRASAPFDHPQLFVPNGHVGNSNWVLDFGGGIALDSFMEVPATGKLGGAPQPNFLEKP